MVHAKSLDANRDFKVPGLEELLEVTGKVESVIADQQSVMGQLQRRVWALEGGLKRKERLGIRGNEPGGGRADLSDTRYMHRGY